LAVDLQVGHITHPYLIRPRDSSIDQRIAVAFAVKESTHPRHAPIQPRAAALNAVLSHDSLHAPTTHVFPLTLQRFVHSRTAIGLTTDRMLVLDLVQQHRVSI
jgi:hypothetical protein